MSQSRSLALLPAFLLLCAISLLHLLIAPYTKVEESFTLHAVHDILTHGREFSKVRPFFSRANNSMTIGNSPDLLNGVSFHPFC
jgi:hypothetical protein